MSNKFFSGQRWICDADAELGVGTVVESDARQVRIEFPASGEVRSYARQGAPLSRLQLQAGDLLQDREGQEYEVEACTEQSGLLLYTVRNDAGVVSQLHESEISDHLRFGRPQQRLFGSRVDQDQWFSLRYLGWLQAARNARSPVYGLAGARVSLIPHQLYIAAEVAQRYAPRVLLADEVGLGKTIEAGLILHRMLLSGRVRRALIVVPEPLLHQWLVEMLRRFNIRCALFDEERFGNSTTDNPFLEEQQVLCSLEFLVSRPEVARAALSADWDMLIVDEAHHLQWSPEDASLEYELVAELAARALGVLLLTATPEQLGQSGHFARLHLLDPHRYYDYEEFLAEEKSYLPVAELAAKLLDEASLTSEEKARLTSMTDEDPDQDPELVVEKLLDRHGTGRILFRNTRSAIKGFPRRRLLPAPLPYPDEYEDVGDGVDSMIYPELGHEAWHSFDPRIPWLLDTVTQLAGEKILVICARAETAVTLRETLHKKYALACALFHEHMEIVARDRAAAYFADTDNGAQLLVCSEIGSEGRNFQFAHHLVLFDLPLEADLLEQRIGRLDRIGQTETIKLHVPYFEGSPQEVLFRWYEEGLQSFTSTTSVASVLYQRYADRLLEALNEPGRLTTLLDQVKAARQQLQADLVSGRDRLLELHSHQPDKAAQLVQGILDKEDRSALLDYMERYWDMFGVEHEPGPGQSLVLQTGSHMLHERFPGLGEEGATVTFSRSDALAHEDRLYLTWEHPMVTGAMELLSSSALGSVAVTVLAKSDLPPGTVLVELVYIAECAAPDSLEVKRFMPATPIRLLLDKAGNNLAGKLSHEQLQGSCISRDKQTVVKVIKSLEPLLRGLLKKGDAIADSVGSALARHAHDAMNQQLGDELERMLHLAQVNPNVREIEIQYMRERIELLQQHIMKTMVRLDGIRVIVSG